MLNIIPFDKQEVYQEQVLPLLKELDRICSAEQIPYFFSAAVAEDGEDTTYKTMGRTAIPMGMLLSHDKIVDYEKVHAGFETFLPGTIPEIVLTPEDSNDIAASEVEADGDAEADTDVDEA